IESGQGDFIYINHNEVYDNSRVTCDAQGSGIAVVTTKAVPNYTPSGMDLSFAPFRNIIEFNVAHNNALTQCGSAGNKYDTDGNGIIMDTLDYFIKPYPYQTLVAFNIAYNNGGAGVHIFHSSNVTVANNTAFNNQIDPFNSQGVRPQIDTSGGDNNLVINNIAYGVPAESLSDPRCQGTNPCTLFYIDAFVGGNAGWSDSNNSWSHNISYALGSSVADANGNNFFDNDVGKYTCTDNRCIPITPAPNIWVAPPSTTTLATSVNDLANFALQAGSPAIGYVQPESYLPAWDADVGACDLSLQPCP